MSSTISVEIAPGELVDKLTILDIKLDRLRDPAKRRNVEAERRILAKAYDELSAAEAVARLRETLLSVNEQLWDIEDQIRDCERRQDFGSAFVALARAVYKTNDRRAALKREINVALSSSLFEEKSYRSYA